MDNLYTREQIQSYKEQFDRDGFLLLPGVLAPERVAKLNAAIDEIIGQEPEDLAYNIYNSVERHPAIADLIDEPLVLPLVTNLLGFAIQLLISHLTIRHPNPQEVKTATNSFINWHQDGPHPNFPKINGLTSMYYLKTCYILSDMSEHGRGNTKVIPGSHNRQFRPDHVDVKESLADEVAICGKPGDVFIFGQNLWHAGSPNLSNFTRRQLFLGYCPLWMKPIDYHQASPHMLEGASPIRQQLLGQISDNKFKFYVPDAEMTPLKSLWLDL